MEVKTYKITCTIKSANRHELMFKITYKKSEIYTDSNKIQFILPESATILNDINELIDVNDYNQINIEWQ